MKKLNLEEIKKYWAYEEVSKNYKINIKETKESVQVTISSKYGVEAMFSVKHYLYETDTLRIEGYDVYDKDYKITNSREKD